LILHGLGSGASRITAYCGKGSPNRPQRPALRSKLARAGIGASSP
jgi:hypothetical protein